MRSLKQIGFVCVLAVCNGCGSASSGELKPISAADLVTQYSRSGAETRARYDGKEVVISGRASMPATVAPELGGQGSLSLEEKIGGVGPKIICWFSSDQREEFSRVSAGTSVTVKGVFNGEAGINLKFCKLIRVEQTN